MDAANYCITESSKQLCSVWLKISRQPFVDVIARTLSSYTGCDHFYSAHNHFVLARYRISGEIPDKRLFKPFYSVDDSIPTRSWHTSKSHKFAR